MRHPGLRLILALALAACATLAACAVDTGVMQVDIELVPAPVAAWPTGVDAAAYVSLPQAGGEVLVDGMAGTGAARVFPLPPPPAGWSYELHLGVADDTRASLPGGAAGEVEERAIPLVAVPGADGLWTASFADADVDAALGGLRTAAVALVDATGAVDELTLLEGSVAAQAAGQPGAEGDSGHVH